MVKRSLTIEIGTVDANPAKKPRLGTPYPRNFVVKEKEEEDKSFCNKCCIIL